MNTKTLSNEDATYFTHLDDKDVPSHLQETVANWRKLAAEHRYSGPVVWRVREGFTLKEHAPKAGKVYEDFKYLQEWKLKNDEPTKSCYAFFVPRLIAGSAGKTIAEHVALLSEVRKCYNLPEQHLSSFGSVTMLSGLVLAYLKQHNDNSLLKRHLVRTDTLLHEVGFRLSLNFSSGALRCDYWFGGVASLSGVFPLGVELE